MGVTILGVVTLVWILDRPNRNAAEAVTLFSSMEEALRWAVDKFAELQVIRLLPLNFRLEWRICYSVLIQNLHCKRWGFTASSANIPSGVMCCLQGSGSKSAHRLQINLPAAEAAASKAEAVIQAANPARHPDTQDTAGLVWVSSMNLWACMRITCRENDIRVIRR